MNRIWKYTLKPLDCQTIEMPIFSEILTVQLQEDKLQLWCLVNSNDKMGLREIVIIGTGHSIKEDFKGTYIGTVQMFNNRLVCHVFDNGYVK